MDNMNGHRIVQRLFHVIGVRVEAAGAILEQAGRSDTAESTGYAQQLHALADEIHILADAVIALDGTSNDAPA
jgi:N-acetylglucosamine kinase-like BadF-type ATPase